MKRRVFVVLVVALSPFVMRAGTHFLPGIKHTYIDNPTTVQQSDTIVADLEDLEAMIGDSVLHEDTVYYGPVRPKGFNGLRFILDRRHRYSGDNFVNKSFLDHTYLDFGGGITNYLPNDHFRYTPFANFHVGFGKDLSPMSSVRLQLTGGWGFVKEANLLTSKTTYQSFGAHVDYLFNFTNYMLGYRPERRLTVSGVAGLGLQSSKLSATDGSIITSYATTSAMSYDARFGLQFRVSTSPHAAFAVEPFIRLATRKQDLVEGTKFNSLDFGYGANLSYIWYFWPEVSKKNDLGDFMKKFEEDERMFQEKYAKKHWRRPMFFDYSIGPAYFNKTNLSMGNSIGYTANAYFGWWLSPVLGVRSGIHITNADWADNSKVPSHGPLRTKSLLGVRGMALDLLFNPFGFNRNFNWDNKVGVNLLAGYEFGRMRVVNEEHNHYVKSNYVSYRVGTQLWMKLTNDLRLNVEPSYAFIEQYQGFDQRKQYEELAIKLGLTMLFRDKPSREKFNLDSIGVVNRYSQLSGFFLGGGLGWNTTVRTWRYSTGASPLLKNGTLFAGYNLNAYHGIRLNGEYLTDPIWVENSGHTATKKHLMENVLVSLDYQLNLLNAIAGYNPYRRWNTYIYGGPSLAMGSAGTDFALNFGGMLTYNITPSLALFYSHTVYRMPKERYITTQVYKDEGTFVNSLNVGLMYNVNHTFKEMQKMLTCDYTQQPLSFEYSIGPVWYTNLPISVGSSMGYTANANLGWWLNSALGVRGGVHISNADWSHATTGLRKNNLGFFATTLDLMFNPLGITKIYDWNAPVGFNLFGGFGLGKIRFVKDWDSAYEGKFTEFRLGAQLWLKLCNDLRLNLEPTYSMLGNFSGNKVVDKTHEMALKVGVSMLLRDRSKDKDVETKDAKDLMPSGIFVGGGLGWNTTVHTWRYTGQGSSLIKNGLLFAGYNLNDYHGVRLSGEYLSDKIWVDYGGSSLEPMKFHNTLLSLDYQFNMFNAIAGVNPARRWNVSVYTGPSLALGDGASFAWNFGGILTYRVAPNLSLFYSHNVYRMSKDRYKSAQIYRTPGTIVNSLNIGMQYSLQGTFGKSQPGVNNPLACDYMYQPLSFEYSIGPVWYTNLPISVGSSMGYTANANLGWWLNSALGVRGGVHISNADWSHATTGLRKNNLGFFATTLDLMFNPLGITKIYDWNAPVGFNLFGGFGLGKIRFVKDWDSAYEGKFTEFRLGAQLWLKLCNDLRLNLEPTYSMLGNFSGNKVVDKTHEMALKVGVSMLLRDRSKDKDVETKDAKDLMPSGIFVGGGLGWNTTVHTWRYTGQGSSLIKNGLLFAGYNLNDYHGVRLSGEYLSDKIWVDYGGSSLEPMKFHNTLLSLDYQFNMFNAIAGVNPARRWNVSVYTGPSLALGDGASFAWNFGGILTYRVAPNLSLFYSHNVYRMSKDRYKSAQIYRTPGTIVNSLNIGLQYHLGGTFGKSQPGANNPLACDYARQPFFFEYNIGPSWYNKVKVSSGSSIGYTANANLGWWLNSALGVRGGIHISNGDWDRSSAKHMKYQLGFVAGTLDLMFNPLGITKIYDWKAPAGFNIFGGFGAGKIRFVKDWDKAYEGKFNEFRLGAQLWVKLSDDLRFNIEPTYSMMGRFSGNKVLKNANELAIKLGMSLLLNGNEHLNGKKVQQAKGQEEVDAGLFIGGGFGWNTAVHTWRYTGQSNPLLKNGVVFVGYNLDDYHGIRLSGEYLTDKIWIDNGGSSLDPMEFKNTAVSLNYQFNALNMISGVNPNRQWNLSFYGGPSLVLGKAGTELAFNLGGILSYHLTKDLSLFYSHTVYRMSKDRYNSAQIYRTPGTFVNSLNIGIQYRLASLFKK